MILRDVLPPITEKQFMGEVRTYAQVMGWHVWHQLNSSGTASGWPDLVCIRRPRIVFIELKAQRGKVTAAQRFVIDELRACGQEAWIWRPSDWPLIEELLR